MATTTGGKLNLVKPELIDDFKVTIGTDLPANFQKIDDEFSAFSAIEESGSNEKGKYIKFADGTMICWINTTLTDGSVGSQFGNLYSSVDKIVTFPVAFVSVPVVSDTCPATTRRVFLHVKTLQPASVTIVAVSGESFSYQTLGFNLMAIGRWK